MLLKPIGNKWFWILGNWISPRHKVTLKMNGLWARLGHLVLIRWPIRVLIDFNPYCCVLICLIPPKCVWVILMLTNDNVPGALEAYNSLSPPPPGENTECE